MDEPEQHVESRELTTEGIHVRDIEKREIEARVVPWDDVIQTSAGYEMFERGAFSGTQAQDVVLRMSHQDPPAGRGIALEDRADGAYMIFRVSKTAKGDEILTLASDGVTKGVSVGFETVPGGTDFRVVEGQRTAVYTRAKLREVSTTWNPAYTRAQVLSIREQEVEETPVAETTAEPTTAVDLSAITHQISEALEKRDASVTETQEKVLDRLEKIEERYRAQISVPTTEKAQPKFLDWLELSLKKRAGEVVPASVIKERELEDVLLGDQYVPDAVRGEVVAFINPRRPFLQSVPEVAFPTGSSAISIPVVTQQPEAAVQSEEKTEVASRALKIENALVQAKMIAGAVDVSYQFIRNGPRTYFDILRRAMFAAYAATAEAEAISDLLNGLTIGITTLDPQDGGTIDPENLLLGEAWQNSMDVALVPPDTLWLSPAAMAAFIDAKADGTNMPLYGQITSSINAGGQSGTLSGLRVVTVPALSDSGVDAIVGPSEQVVWAEDGTFELTADKPAILGRDIALAGSLLVMPLAPEAFTTYALVS